MTFHPCSVGHHVKEFGYDPKTKLMGVRFRNSTGTWFYKDVPEDVFAAFMATPSPGRFVQRVLATQFKGEKA